MLKGKVSGFQQYLYADIEETGVWVRGHADWLYTHSCLVPLQDSICKDTVMHPFF